MEDLSLQANSTLVWKKKITEKNVAFLKALGRRSALPLVAPAANQGSRNSVWNWRRLVCLFVFFSLRPENPFNQSISSDLMDYESSLIQVHLSSALIGRAGDQSEIKALDRNGWRSFLQGSALISHHISSSFFFLFDIAGISAIFFCWLWLKMADA